MPNLDTIKNIFNREPKNIFDWETGQGDVTTWKDDWVLDNLKQLDLLGTANQNLDDLHMRRDWKAIDKASQNIRDLAPHNKKFQIFYPAYLEYTELIKAREKQSKENIKKAYGGTVQKLQSGGSVEDRAEPTITQMQQQAGLGQSPTLPTEGTVSYTDITPTAADTLAITPLGTPSQITPQATTTAQQITTPTKTAAGAAAEVPIEGAGAVALPEVTAETGAMTTGAQITDPQGTVSTDAQVTAQTGSAAQAVAATRTLSASDLAAMKETGELATAAQLSDLGVTAAQVTAETAEVDSLATIQGQLQKLSTEFADQNIPSFMAGAVRAANATVNARGLGRSSIAAQAIYQAALESSVAIAAQDAKVYEQFSAMNLTNKQQSAVLNAEIRSRIQGQELTQEQQSRVINAARISEANNINLNNQQQVALENSRLTQNMNLTNLNNKQQSAMSNAATFAAMDTSNLDARVRSAQQNAQSFLQLDLQNLSNQQQAAVVNQQAKTQRMFNYEAAENARAQFNAKTTQQNDQFFAELGNQVDRNNATRVDSMKEFNISQQNSIGKYNAELENQRAEFNANLETIINQSNAQWRRGITTANNNGLNQANQVNAMNLLDISQNSLNQMWQRYRDESMWSMSAVENTLSRAHSSAIAAMNNDFQKEMYEEQLKDSVAISLGSWALGTIEERLLGALGN